MGGIDELSVERLSGFLYAVSHLTRPNGSCEVFAFSTIYRRNEGNLADAINQHYADQYVFDLEICDIYENWYIGLDVELDRGLFDNLIDCELVEKIKPMLKFRASDMVGDAFSLRTDTLEFTTLHEKGTSKFLSIYNDNSSLFIQINQRQA